MTTRPPSFAHDDPPPLIEAQKITKRFPGVVALDRVDLVLNAGEVLAVIGENGAGKSTLMRILAGVERPDGGRILVAGRQQSFASVQDATAAGITLIHQELNLCDNLSVEANIFLGREPRRWAWIRRRAVRRQARVVLERVGLDVDPAQRVERLSIGQQQMVEIARALAVDARVLIMDEPTSSLSPHEAERLFQVIEQLRQRGVGIIYISHRLSEVGRVADRVLVLRDGRKVGTLNRAEATRERMVRLMVGRDVRRLPQQRSTRNTEPVLAVESLATSTYPQHRISFHVRAGEIVGLAGLVGAGRTELLRTIFGIDRPLHGRVQVDGNPVAVRQPYDAIACGVALVPEDRKQHGLILEMTVRANLSLAVLHRQAKWCGWIDRAAELRLAVDSMRRLRIRAPDSRQRVEYLSGGNQQKVVLGKWLALMPRVLLLDEPTRGIDVGAKQEIYTLIRKLADDGVAILFASSEMEEIIALADRVLVMHEGRLTGSLSGARITEQMIMHLATGTDIG